jgi:hypothetical protein
VILWESLGAGEKEECLKVLETAVKDAMLKGGAEFQRQKVLNRAACNWSKEFLRTTDIGSSRISYRIRQVACAGVKCDLMDSTTLGVGIYASAPRG